MQTKYKQNFIVVDFPGKLRCVDISLAGAELRRQRYNENKLILRFVFTKEKSVSDMANLIWL